MDFDHVFDFLSYTDRLKSVARANVLMDGSRAENSAEHSWHVALYAMVFGAGAGAISMILLHDLIEIEVGDHPIHLDHDLAALAVAEQAAAQRVFGCFPDGGHLLQLWQEFEAGQSDDARFARRMDHVQPMFQVLQSVAPLPDHVQIVRDNMAFGRAARLRDEWPEAMAAADALLQGGKVPGDFGRRLRFLAQADRLKSVLRAGVIHSGRRENSAEHSWHLALYALVLAELAPQGADVDRVIRMLILHDLVEIDTGDVPIHAAGGLAHGSAARVAAEQAAADRLFGLLPAAQAADFRALWDEFEAGETPDARFAKALDRAQPVWLNIAAEGGTWAEFGVTWDQLQSRVGDRIARGSPRLWDWLQGRARGYFNV
ncbi:MAG: HD domain-containing protein [Paracoccus sp. (in: a-proteobacteria)]|uniref:HD domain-containing protein n=1 Tax=Paracoccus sp. TaxID=267 RepID=UPI0026E074A6|nr:HD domain-containing protein [Paracoccus sp. (in: a-proteobacteria)]MDO5613522.1 HD domain-containing protein [Paracoccus sp. (in: a-proteobacteria)]